MGPRNSGSQRVVRYRVCFLVEFARLERRSEDSKALIVWLLLFRGVVEAPTVVLSSSFDDLGVSVIPGKHGRYRENA